MKRFFTCLFMALSVSVFLNLCDTADVPKNDGQDEQVTPDDKQDDGQKDQMPPADLPAWETAKQAVVSMGVGWNIGNTLDSVGDLTHDGSDWQYWETCWGQEVTRPELFVMMKNAGFDAVRVPVTWSVHMDMEGKVSRSWMNRVHQIVDYVLDAGLYCIINVHHDTGSADHAWLIASGKDYEAQKDRFEYLWKQIAEEFKDYDHHLLFESFNEMLDSRRSWCFASYNGGYDAAFAKDAYDAINSYAQSFVDVVRATGGNNMVRNLIVNTYGACSGQGVWNAHLKDPLINMALPDDLSEGHLIFEVHSYISIDDMEKAKGNAEDMFAAVTANLVSKGAPVIFGEWGTSGDAPSREKKVEYIDFFMKAVKQRGFGAFYWMGLSDGPLRSFPAFSDPDYAEAMVKAYHGQGHQGEYPAIEDFDVSYTVTYSKQWAEVNVVNRKISTDSYKGVRVVLDEDPGKSTLSIKLYYPEEKTQSTGFSGKELTVMFNRDVVGDEISRITLQYLQQPPFSMSVRGAFLIKDDGTEEILSLSPFWGCSVDTVAEPVQAS